jgi:hypothetical protein
MLASLTAFLLLSCTSPAATLTATVNDTRSHGAVGDPFLSLDEAIRLAGGSLAMSQLSMAEMGQLSGTGTMVDCIAIDPALTPVITLQAPLSDVMAMAMPGMGMLTIQGMGMGMGSAMPVLAGNGHARILTLRTHMVQVMGLELRGGGVGVDVRTTMGAMTMGSMAMVMDCVLTGQTVAGIRVHAGGTAETTALMTCRTAFRNMPVGILVDDQSTQGGLMTEDEFLDFDGVGTAYDIAGNGRQNLSMNTVFRTRVRNGGRFVRLVRGAQSSQQHMLRVVHCEAAVSGDAIEVQGTAAGLTMLHHHQSVLQAGAGFHALRAVPRTAQFDLHGSENTLVGNVTLSGNLFTQRVWHQSNTYRNCTFTLDNDGAQPNLLWNRFEGGTVASTAQARTPSRFRASEFRGTAIVAGAALAAITLDGCFRSGGSLAGPVTVLNPAPGAFLASASVDPAAPAIGSTLSLRSELPPGIGGIWHFAIAYPRPNTSAEPYRFYGDPFAAIALPGMVVFVNRTDIPVPADPSLVGVEFVVQLVALPLFGQSWMPALYLPACSLVRPRM